MKILAMEKDVAGVTGERCEPYLREEAARVWELYQEGVIREIYFRQDCPQAVLILECDDAAGATQILGTLPLVRKGLIDFDAIPLKAYPGFSRLFGR
jgi:muconolactone delta-isomerase